MSFRANPAGFCSTTAKLLSCFGVQLTTNNFLFQRKEGTRNKNQKFLFQKKKKKKHETFVSRIKSFCFKEEKKKNTKQESKVFVSRKRRKEEEHQTRRQRC